MASPTPEARDGGLISGFDRLRGTLDALGPSEFGEKRLSHFRRFAEFGFPTHRDEEFRYLDFGVVSTTSWQLAYGANLDREHVERTPFGTIDAVHLVFVNGQFAPELSSADTLPEGTFVDSLQAAHDAGIPGREKLGQIATLEGRLGSTNDERFVDLNSAYVQEGAFIHLPRGSSLDRPIHLCLITQADHAPIAVFPRVLIDVEEGASVTVLESHVGLSGRVLNVPVIEIDVATRANVEHVRYVKEGLESCHVGNVAVRQAGDSVYTSVTANLGGAIVRHDVNVNHTGAHVETWLDGASVALEGETVDNHTRLDHAFPDGRSFETYKTIVDANGRGVFNGKIFVYEDAQRTDAKQTNQGLLLSGRAQFDTKPQLEIFADDVKCTHGATVGQLREDAMFYLRARGIPETQARALLVQAFAAAAFERVSNEDVREALDSALMAKLGA